MPFFRFSNVIMLKGRIFFDKLADAGPRHPPPTAAWKISFRGYFYIQYKPLWAIAQEKNSAATGVTGGEKGLLRIRMKKVVALFVILRAWSTGMFPASLPASYHLLSARCKGYTPSWGTKLNVTCWLSRRRENSQPGRCGAGSQERVQLIAGGERNPRPGKAANPPPPAPCAARRCFPSPPEHRGLGHPPSGFAAPGPGRCLLGPGVQLIRTVHGHGGVEPWQHQHGG